MTRTDIVQSVENRRDVESMVLRAQMMSQGWVKQLGREDGATIADEIITRIAEQPDDGDTVAAAAVGYIKSRLDAYKERGVSDSMVEIWRIECATELYQRFKEFHTANHRPIH